MGKSGVQFNRGWPRPARVDTQEGGQILRDETDRNVGSRQPEQRGTTLLCLDLSGMSHYEISDVLALSVACIASYSGCRLRDTGFRANAYDPGFHFEG
jgi:hypothetical protein